MRYRCAFALAAMLWPAGAVAADFRASLGVQGEYDSNVFRRESDVEDDFVAYVVPRIELFENEGKLHYEVGYQFPYQHSIDSRALRDFNHVGDVGARYHWSEATQIGFRNRFRYEETLSNRFDDTPVIQDQDRNRRVTRNDAQIEFEHKLTPRLSSTSSLGHELYYTDQRDRSDNRTVSGSSGLVYWISERQTLGGGLFAAYQDFDQALDAPILGVPPAPDTQREIPDSWALFVGPYLSWSYRIDPQSQLRIQAGPTYIYSDRETAELVDLGTGLPIPGSEQPSDSDARISAFGQVSIDRRWSPTMLSGLSYQRRQDAASGVSGSAILDAVALTHTWLLAERWTLGLRGDWTQRKSATDVRTGIEDLDTQRWGAGASLGYRITRNLVGSVRYQYAQQESDSATAGRASDFDGHVATIGLNYVIDPINLW